MKNCNDNLSNKTKLVYRLTRDSLIAPVKIHFLFEYWRVRTNVVRPLQGRTLFINTQTNKHVRLYSTKQGLWFITGFTDGEGCFRINILKDDKNRTG